MTDKIDNEALRSHESMREQNARFQSISASKREPTRYLLHMQDLYLDLLKEYTLHDIGNKFYYNFPFR